MMLLEICENEDCTEYGGGWIAIRANSKSELQEYMEKTEPQECPVCGESLQYHVEADDGEDDPGLIVTEVVELTAAEFEEYKLHCENNPTASYDTLEPWDTIEGLEYELNAEAEERRQELE